MPDASDGNAWRRRLHVADTTALGNLPSIAVRKTAENVLLEGCNLVGALERAWSAQKREHHSNAPREPLHPRNRCRYTSDNATAVISHLDDLGDVEATFLEFRHWQEDSAGHLSVDTAAELRRLVQAANTSSPITLQTILALRMYKTHARIRGGRVDEPPSQALPALLRELASATIEQHPIEPDSYIVWGHRHCANLVSNLLECSGDTVYIQDLTDAMIYNDLRGSDLTKLQMQYAQRTAALGRLPAGHSALGDTTKSMARDILLELSEPALASLLATTSGLAQANQPMDSMSPMQLLSDSNLLEVETLRAAAVRHAMLPGLKNRLGALLELAKKSNKKLATANTTHVAPWWVPGSQDTRLRQMTLSRVVGRSTARPARTASHRRPNHRAPRTQHQSAANPARPPPPPPRSERRPSTRNVKSAAVYGTSDQSRHPKLAKGGAKKLVAKPTATVKGNAEDRFEATVIPTLEASRLAKTGSQPHRTQQPALTPGLRKNEVVAISVPLPVPQLLQSYWDGPTEQREGEAPAAAISATWAHSKVAPILPVSMPDLRLTITRDGQTMPFDPYNLPEDTPVTDPLSATSSVLAATTGVVATDDSLQITLADIIWGSLPPRPEHSVLSVATAGLPADVAARLSCPEDLIRWIQGKGLLQLPEYLSLTLILDTALLPWAIVHRDSPSGQLKQSLYSLARTAVDRVQPPSAMDSAAAAAHSAPRSKAQLYGGRSTPLPAALVAESETGPVVYLLLPENNILEFSPLSAQAVMVDDSAQDRGDLKDAVLAIWAPRFNSEHVRVRDAILGRLEQATDRVANHEGNLFSEVVRPALHFAEPAPLEAQQPSNKRPRASLTDSPEPPAQTLARSSSNLQRPPATPTSRVLRQDRLRARRSLQPPGTPRPAAARRPSLPELIERNRHAPLKDARATAASGSPAPRQQQEPQSFNPQPDGDSTLVAHAPQETRPDQRDDGSQGSEQQ